jgi:hypothetical protein
VDENGDILLELDEEDVSLLEHELRDAISRKAWGYEWLGALASHLGAWERA